MHFFMSVVMYGNSMLYSFSICRFEASRGRVDKMPIDLSSWLAGIANVNHKIHYPTKVVSYGPLLSYTFPIIWLFCYVYFFLALSLTFPLSAGITTIFANAPILGHLVSHVFFHNKMIVLDSLLINFQHLQLMPRVSYVI